MVGAVVKGTPERSGQPGAAIPPPLCHVKCLSCDMSVPRPLLASRLRKKMGKLLGRITAQVCKRKPQACVHGDSYCHTSITSNAIMLKLAHLYVCTSASLVSVYVCCRRPTMQMFGRFTPTTILPVRILRTTRRYVYGNHSRVRYNY